MGRSWTSQPPGLVAVRLNVTPETRLKLNKLAGAAGVAMSRIARELVEAVCNGETVTAERLVARMRQEKLHQLSEGEEKPAAEKPRGPRGRPRKSSGPTRPPGQS
jgi:hypothetical protein